MEQTCSRCSRVNPAEAAYCYYDGALLGGRAAPGRPTAAGAQTFPSPFVFPSGRRCHNFDELALACQADWEVARDLLRQGLLERFLSGLGRADLALAAREAARFPDPDRGLDRLLGNLPSDVLEPPRLRAEPLDVHLGVLAVGEDRRFDLHLENQGMRLLYGSVVCEDTPWLALGDGAGSPEKLFEVGSETVLPVQVKGKCLRAGTRPLEGRLVVESNGGSATILIRAEVPPRPFPEGVLAGALTPRQLAEKARENPRAAAAYFEKGAVAQWYKDNGWTYPVQGPPASGLGAVQQFFEALGLTAPPKVEINPRAVTLTGSAGDSLQARLEVTSQEKRPVYAHATSNQPWLEVGRPELNGRRASIPLHVPSVPDREGETLTAKVTVRSNGNQRFVVPVTLQVGGSLQFDQPPLAAGSRIEDRGSKQREPRAASLEPRTAEARIGWVHLVPLAVLVLALGGVLLYDAFSARKGAGFHGDSPYAGALDPEPRLGVEFDGRRRFGIVMLKESDPDNPGKRKRLTFEEKGGTNNTCLKVDDFEYLFGNQNHGKWRKREVKLADRYGWESIFEFDRQRILVTQRVELVLGEQTRLIDTCLVRYTVENRDTTAHEVGLRVLLDTFIGANDGVPFLVPGQKGLLETMRRFEQKEIPDYVQALEHGDLQNPGTIAHLTLKLPDYEPVHQLDVRRWPGTTEAKWDWESQPMNADPARRDSSVTLYWVYQKMAPGEKRVMAFAYGLNAIATEGDAKLGLTAGGDFRPGAEFTVTAYVKGPQPGQRVRLLLPGGFSFAEGQEAEQAPEGGGDLGQVSWKVRAGAAGDYVLEATSGLSRASYKVQVRPRRLY